MYLADASIKNRDGAHRKVQQVSANLRLLLSFHYFQNADLDELFATYFTPPYPEVFLDSGGFSAMTQGAHIGLDAYCAFIKRFSHLLTAYANLDVIGNAQKTLVNQHQMEAKGLRPVPVFHVNEPMHYLEDYLARYQYIALGGLVPYMRSAKRNVMPWLVRCFKMAQGKAVYHGFGCTSWDVVCALPWYSVDSSSWVAGCRYGEVPLFDYRQGKFFTIRLGNHAQCYTHSLLLRSLGFSPADFSDRSRNDAGKIYTVAALSYIQAEQWLRKRHGDIDIPTVTEAANDSRRLSHGLNMYLVADVSRIHRLADGFGKGER